MTSDQKYLSPRELADALGMARPTIIRWLKRGWIEHTTLPNGRRLIHPSELERLLPGGIEAQPVALPKEGHGG